ncbi:MAG: hypothetical protein Ta2F_03720 [Termitinemataceae bacterium]|nr:MAG: hypothetical protein Ta2F_03720 [Termitinemataceae bacterium]
MKFDHSGMFGLLFTVIPLIFFLIIHYKLKFPVICRLTDPLYSGAASTKRKSKNSRMLRTNSSLTAIQKTLSIRYFFSSFFFCLFYILIIAALRGPRWGTRIVQQLQHGADVLIAFDISRSMNVRDAPSINKDDGTNVSSRLERAVWITKKIISSFDNAQSVNIRLGVAIGKGEAVLAVPLTDDREAVYAILDNLSTMSMTSRGTNLEKLLDVSQQAFQEDFPSARQILLFTDGESLAGSINSALDRLNAKNIKIAAVGLGSVYGAPVPEAGIPADSSQRIKRKAPVISYLKADALMSALSRTGGIYIDGNREESPILLADTIKPNAISNAWVTREKSGERWHIFVILALISLSVSTLFTLRVKR